MNRRRVLFCRVCCLCALIFISLKAMAQQPEVKIDLNMNNRPPAEAEYQYPTGTHTPWVVVSKPSGNTVADTLVKNGITFILRKGPRGVTLSPTYYKSGVDANVDPNLLFDSRFTNDGIFVKDGDFAQGASIDLIVKGLPGGIHNVTTFHNITDNVIPDNVCPIDVYVNDVLKIDNLIPTVRLRKITEVATAELEINVVEGEDVVISMRAETSGTQPVKNVFLNGIYLNAVNVGKKARVIDPVNLGEHLDIPIGGNYTLKWESSPTALSHDVYFGTDSAGVATADKNSQYYKGNQEKADTTYAVSNLYTMESYYWRIDEVSSTNTYKGDVWMFRSRQLAFPGAEGYGRFARGGRGGKVVYVTNLNDSGPGSFREAVTNDIGPRTIVFDVGGVINLQSRLVLSQRHVTIAGQTAPGKGILLRKSPFGIGADDAIVRFVRLRLGAGPTADGMGMNGNNSIMDHCSISWTIDEAFSSRGAKNITLQKTLISEALNAANHQNYGPGAEHGYAATVGGNTSSLHHNLLAHCYGRNWSLGGGLDAAGYFASKLDIRNNVVYNWGSRATDGGAYEVNFVNNYYKPGPGTTQEWVLRAQYENVGMGTQKYYFAGNVMPPYPGKRGTLATGFNETNQALGRTIQYSNGNPPLIYDPFVNQPFFEHYVTTQTAYHGYKVVLSDVGANQPFFDAHDTRMVNETLAGTSTTVGSVTGKKGFPDTEMDSGGYENYPSVARSESWDTDKDGLPDWWENIHNLNPNSAPGDFSDSNADSDRDGYTNLDYYLQWMAEPHFFPIGGNTVSIDLKELSKGFSSSPSFMLSNVINGSATPVNNGVVEFTITDNGLASFEFTVTDSDNHTMTRKVNVVGGVDLTLPVTMTDLKASRRNNKEAQLSWKTVQESNNSHFEVLRSDDGSEFRNLGVRVSSKAVNGNSIKPLSYDFIDFNNNVNDTYYQLIQKDRDGQTAHSEVKVVKGNNTEFNVWPVPSKGDVFLSVSELKYPATLYVFDILGKKIESRNLVSNQTETIVLETKGIYILRVKDTKKKSDLFTQKIIIQ